MQISVSSLLTETWLNESIINQDLMLNNFQVPFRRDRVGDSHGGILVYVKDGIPCKRRTDLELINIECILVEVNVRNKSFSGNILSATKFASLDIIRH